MGDIATLVRTPVEIDPVAQYSPIGVRGFGRGLISYPSLAGSELGKLRYFALGAERLIVSNIKGWEGAVAITSQAEIGRVASNRFLQYTVDADEADLRYLAHWLVSDRGLAALGAASPGSADRNRTLSIRSFEAIRVPLPPLVDQCRIAAHLDSLASVPAVSNGRSGTDDLWDGMRGCPPSGQRMRIENLVQQVTRPVVVDADVIYPMCGVRWYGQGLFERERKVGSSLSAKTVFEVRQGDLVYNRLFAWKQSFAVAGKSAGYVSNEFPTFLIDDSAIRPEVLRFLLLTESFTAAVNAASSGSTPTSRNRLKVQEFLNLTVDVPPLAVQTRLVTTLDLVEAARRTEKRKDALTAALLPAARNEIFSSML